MNTSPAGGTRRSFLKASVVAGAAVVVARRARASSTRPSSAAACRMRPELRGEDVSSGVEIIQLTSDPDVPTCHVYMEAQIFTPDSKRFVLHRSAHPHGSDRKDPRHQYLLCDIDDNFAMHPLTDELGTTGPCISPDGRFFYYFVDQTGSGGSLTLKRVNLDGTDRQTLVTIDGALPGTDFRPTRVYSLSSISSDGAKLAISACLNNRITPVEYGLMIFDLRAPGVQVVFHGSNWANVHPQFCRSVDPVEKRDVLVQENHGHRMSSSGESMPSRDSAGLDIHVFRDDGSNLRDMPWGRDGVEFCEGHQCWRGRSGWVITSVGVKGSARLIESRPVAPGGHIGAKTPGAIRNQLTREFPNPQFHHFATDLAGRKLITDYQKVTPEARLYVARLGVAGEEPLTDFKCVARPRPSGKKTSHMHPFFSPDGRMAFFNSDESGLLQAYAMRGLDA